MFPEKFTTHKHVAKVYLPLLFERSDLLRVLCPNRFCCVPVVPLALESRTQYRPALALDDAGVDYKELNLK